MASQRIGIEIETTVRDTALPHDQREAIVDMLGTAGHAANGAPDKQQATAEALQAIAVFLARQARHEHQRRIEDIDNHERRCPLRAGPAGILGKIYPFRWPLAAVASVACLSPFVAPSIVRLIDRSAPAIVEAVR